MLTPKKRGNMHGIAGMRSDNHVKVVEGSAKHSQHLVRRCTTCGRDYVALQYFAQHCKAGT